MLAYSRFANPPTKYLMLHTMPSVNKFQCCLVFLSVIVRKNEFKCSNPQEHNNSKDETNTSQEFFALQANLDSPRSRQQTKVLLSACSSKPEATSKVWMFCGNILQNLQDTVGETRLKNLVVPDTPKTWKMPYLYTNI